MSPSRPSPWPLQAGEPARLICPSCGSLAALTSTETIWRSFAQEALYVCPSYPVCDVYVRCHAGTNRPLGSLAGPRLRRLRKEAHDAFDPLWSQPGTLFGRDFAYQVAGELFGVRDFHIGNLDEDGCRSLVARIDELDEAISEAFSGRRAAPAPPDALMLEVLSELFRFGSDEQIATVHLGQLRQFGALPDRAARAGVVQVANDHVTLSPYGRQLLAAM